ncbi:MAG: ferrous iron transporter B, partial [Verrucomicrobia bacterium]
MNAPAAQPAVEDVLRQARQLRWQLGVEVHEQLVQRFYEEAAWLTERAVTRPGQKERFDWDRTLDRLVTSRVWGFPLMLLLFALVFWITIVGSNYPSGWLAGLLVDTIHPALKQAAAGIGLPAWWSG